MSFDSGLGLRIFVQLNESFFYMVWKMIFLGKLCVDTLSSYWTVEKSTVGGEKISLFRAWSDLS